jgi:hypothetical protein
MMRILRHCQKNRTADYATHETRTQLPLSLDEGIVTTLRIASVQYPPFFDRNSHKLPYAWQPAYCRYTPLGK